MITSCQKDQLSGKDVINEAVNIDVSKLNHEAKRYYNNITSFMRLTTTNLTSDQMNMLRTEGSDSILNPIVEEFANLSITDSLGAKISFFDLDTAARKEFFTQWTIPKIK